MKDNFDYIKQKMNDENINAPSDINADFVKQTIDGASVKKPRITVRKTAIGIASGLVACAAAFAIFITASTPNGPISPAPKPPIAMEIGGVSSFSSYDEIEQTLKNMGIKSKTENKIDSIKGGLSFGLSKDEFITSDSIAEVQSHGETYIQVDGVDEGDIIKNDGKYIYYLYNSDNIGIYSATDNPKKVGTIKSDEYLNDIFVHGDKLIAICGSYANKTTCTVYDITDRSKPKKEKSYSQSGYYISSRMIGDEIVIVTNQYISTYTDVPYHTTCKGEYKKISYDCVACPEAPSEPNYLVIEKINVENQDAETQTKAILGASQDIYCTQDTLYVCSTDYSYSDDGDLDDSVYFTDKTQIIKVDLKDDISCVASGKVDGTIKDQYSLDEYDGNLRIATTSYDNEGNEVNNLFVLDNKLNEIGKVTGFAKTESIKAVKFMGDTAYVITYEQTDPLFVIDLSNERKPKILGEAKIDGFSTMLIPVESDRILGIGYSTHNGEIDMEVTDGLKLVLFDISDKTNPKVIDQRVMKNYSSEVQDNPRALVYNAERGSYLMPATRYKNMYGEVVTSGAMIFSVEGDKITKPDIRSAWNTTTRCTFVGDNIYILDSFGNISATKY